MAKTASPKSPLVPLSTLAFANDSDSPVRVHVLAGSDGTRLDAVWGTSQPYRDIPPGRGGCFPLTGFDNQGFLVVTATAMSATGLPSNSAAAHYVCIAPHAVISLVACLTGSAGSRFPNWQPSTLALSMTVEES